MGDVAAVATVAADEAAELDARELGALMREIAEVRHPSVSRPLAEDTAAASQAVAERVRYNLD